MHIPVKDRFACWTFEVVFLLFHGKSLLQGLGWKSGGGRADGNFEPATMIPNGETSHPYKSLISLDNFMISDPRTFATPDLGHFFR